MAGHPRILIELRRNVKRRLRRRMQKCKDAALRVRLNCVLLYAEGRRTPQIAWTLGCSRSTAINAANRFLAEGEAGLLDRRRVNGELKIDDDLLAALVHLLEGSPQDHDWERPTWTLELLAITLGELTRIDVSSSTVRRMLNLLGARWGMPRPTVECPWPKRKKNRRIRELERLVDTLPDDEVVLYQDEVDVHLNPRIGLIVDNCKAHRSAKVRQALKEEFGGSIVLHFLPPYSPEHNPIERLWRELHANVTRNHRHKTIGALLAHAERFLKHAIPYPGSKPSLAKANTSQAA